MCNKCIDDPKQRDESAYLPEPMLAGGVIHGGTSIGGNVASSPLREALGNHENQLAKLNELLSMLEDRVNPLRNSMPTTEKAQHEPTPPKSEIVGTIHDFTDRVQGFQSRVSNLLNDLEI